MLHKEFRRVCPDADTAVLFVHGINGTPNHFCEFVEQVPAELTVVNVLLKGHGGSVGDFARASMEEWKAQINREVESLLKHHDHLVIAGHSMGTLFAIQQAIKHPDKVDGLFLLAVPVKLSVKPRAIRTSLQASLGKAKEDDLWAETAANCYGIAPDWRFWRYIPWVNRYLELLKEINNVKGQLGALKTPCYCYQSKKDELVSLGTCKALRKNRFVTVRLLENSGHYYYEKKDYARLLGDFCSFLGKFIK